MQSNESLLSRAMLRWSLTWRMQCQCKPNAERRELALNILLRYSLISQGKCGARTWLNVKIITNTYLIYKRWHKTKIYKTTFNAQNFHKTLPTPQDILHVKIFNLHTSHFYFSFTFVKYHFLPFIWHFPTNKKKKNLWNRVIFRSSRLLIFNSEIVKTNSELVWISSKLVEISSELVSTRKGQKKWALETGYGYRYT